MFFYKYQAISPLSLAMLRHGEVFFASPQELNDTHEAKPKFVFRGDDDVWRRFIYMVLVDMCILLNLDPESDLSKKIISLRESVFSKIKSTKKSSFEYQQLINILSSSIQTSVPIDWDARDKKIIHEVYCHYVNNVFDTYLEEIIYIASFSLSATSLTMWGHYGDAEKGFCLVYESLDGSVEIESDCELFWGVHGDEDSIQTIGQVNKTLVNLNKIKYAKTPTRINGFGRLSKRFFYSEYESHYDYREEVYSKTTDMHEREIGLVKYTDWKYEKEIRLHLPVCRFIPSSLRSIRVSAKHIKGVIFGPKASKVNRDNVLASLVHLKKYQMSNSEIFIFEAKGIANQYKMQVMPLGTLRDFFSSEIPMVVLFSEANSKSKEEAVIISEIINQS